MTKHTHYILTCTKNHTWNEPIPTTKLAIGEHRLCPKCGGSSWIAPDAPKITKIDTILGEHTLKTEKKVLRKITLSQNFVSNITSSVNEDISIIGKPSVIIKIDPEVEKELTEMGIDARTEIEKAITPSPATVSQTKKIPIPTDLIPTRELLNEESKTTISGEDLRETLRNELKANN